MNLNTFLDIFQADDSCLHDVHNQVRIKYVQDWFLKTSFAFKLQTLKELLSRINSNVGKEIVMNLLENYPEKLLAYITCQTVPKRIGDRNLRDHNRCLEEQTLNAIKNEYVEWFSALNDIAQITVFMNLLEIGGAAIVIKLHDLLYDQQTALPRMQYNADVGVKLQEIINDKAKREDVERTKTCNRDETISKQVEAVCQNLCGSLKKYATQLDNQIKKIYGVTATNIKTKNAGGKSSKKSKKSQKQSKSTTKSKKSKSGKKSKSKQNKDEVDWLQTLPIWIVKTIFGYLDKKTLKKIRDVNSYWEFVVDELSSDQKAQKLIDKHVKKSEETLKQFEETLPPNWKFPDDQNTNRKRLSLKEERLKRLLTRGALHPSLKPKFPIIDCAEFDPDHVEFPRASMDSANLS